MFKRIILTVLMLMLILMTSAFSFDNIHGHKSLVVKLNYDSLYNAAQPAENLEAAQALINSCIEAYGGEEHLNKLNSFKLTYEMNVFSSKKPIELVKLYQRERKFKVTVSKRVGEEERYLDGDLGWYVGKDTIIELYSGRYKAELFSYLTLSMPLSIKTESYDKIKYGQREDDSLSYLYMKKNDSLLVIIGIDPKDHFIKKSEGIIYQDSTTFTFINNFGEFDTFEGYIFPRKLTNISMGLEIARSTISNIEINPAFTDKDFRPKE